MATKNFAPVGGEQEYLFELEFPSVLFSCARFWGGWRGWRTNQCDICYLLQVKRSKTSGRNLQFLYKCLPLKRAAVKIQMICLTSFFLSCEYTSDIFPRLFRPPPAVCQKLRQKNGEENIEEVHQNHNTWELMSSERESRAKQDRDHPAVMVTEPDQHQGTIRENDAGSSLKSLIFPSQGEAFIKWNHTLTQL